MKRKEEIIIITNESNPPSWTIGRVLYQASHPARHPSFDIKAIFW